MYNLLSYLPTALLPSRISFSRYVKQHIFDPLGLSSTTYSCDVARASGNLADGMVRQVVKTGVVVRTFPCLSGGGDDGDGKLVNFHYESLISIRWQLTLVPVVY